MDVYDEVSKKRCNLIEFIRETNERSLSSDSDWTEDDIKVKKFAMLAEEELESKYVIE